MNEAIAINLVFVLLFAAYETTFEATTLAIKLISDYPQVQAELVVYVTSIKACLFHSIGDIFMTKVKYRQGQIFKASLQAKVTNFLESDKFSGYVNECS